MHSSVIAHTLFTEFDIYLFRTGIHYKLFNLFGSHLIELDGKKGCYFAVWAPSATNVTVMGDFNHWRSSQ
ncbi:MAG: 1,4-alpha-glucan branching enzyme, partial [Saprospiraceae bacterium]